MSPTAQGALLASGGALAGLAGGIALGVAKGGQRVLGVKMPGRSPKRVSTRELTRSAKQIGSFGQQLANLATEIRKTRESLTEKR